MIELILIGGAIFGAGMGGMWVKTRRRTNHGNTAVAVDRFEDAARRVSAAQAKWYDLQNESVIVVGGVSPEEAKQAMKAEAEADECSRELYEAWLPVSDVDGEAVASYNDESRITVTEHKKKALVIVERFEKKLAAFEAAIEDLRQ